MLLLHAKFILHALSYCFSHTLAIAALNKYMFALYGPTYILQVWSTFQAWSTLEVCGAIITLICRIYLAQDKNYGPCIAVDISLHGRGELNVLRV